MLVGGGRTKPNQIDNLEDAEGVDDKEGDKPLLLRIACGVPQRETFYYHAPYEEGKKEGQGNGYQGPRPRQSCESGRKVVHMAPEYHTLAP